LNYIHAVAERCVAVHHCRHRRRRRRCSLIVIVTIAARKRKKDKKEKDAGEEGKNWEKGQGGEVDDPREGRVNLLISR